MHKNLNLTGMQEMLKMFTGNEITDNSAGK